MRNQTYRRHLLFPALLLAASLTPLVARAQTAAEAAPVSLNAVSAPVQTVLKSLFASAGIRNFDIEADVQGQVNISLNDVPFALALRTTLGAVNPPLTYSVDRASYHIQVMKVMPVADAEPAPPKRQDGANLNGLSPRVVNLLIGGLQDGESEPNDSTQDHFTKIGIKHYDAVTMADLITRQGGIIVVPPNFVNSAGSGASIAAATPTVTTVPSGPVSSASSPSGPQVASAAANNVLPEGIKRIYALQSDNSLVIESSGTGIPGFSL